MYEYIVKQFIIFEVKDGYAIQNDTSFTVINDKKLIDFFLILDKENRLNITREYINNFFGDETNDVIEFLLTSNLIDEIPVKKMFNKILVYTNDHIIYEALSYFTDQSSNEFEIYYNKDSKVGISDLNNIDKDSLYLVILNPFDYKDFIFICDKLRENNLLTVLCFAYNSTFYMSNLYKKEWYNPCPKCFFSHIETTLRARTKINTTPTFQTIVDLIYNKDISFQVFLPTRKDNIIALLNEIINYKNSDINYLSSRIAKINLAGNVEYDQSTHWELCDCFE